MPGGRLSYQERERIADGLGSGLSYAEIARDLGRPTSTISREVLRNGGPADYRAERAQPATRDRARRGTPKPLKTLPSAEDRAAVDEFSERFSALMTGSGMPKMASRVLACMFTTDSGSRTAAELATRLQVSPASISKAISYLERLGMVNRERDPRRRHERYSFDDDVWYLATAREVQICRAWSNTAREGAEVLGAQTPAGRRLAVMSQFFGFVGQDLEQAAGRWRHMFANGPISSREN